MFQYSHTKDVDDDTYDTDDDAFSIHILEIQMMIVQYSHTEYANNDGSDEDSALMLGSRYSEEDSVFTY